MYGKIYPSCYTGSLYGAGAMVFALWPYVIANARIDDGSQVELNPKMLSGILGEPIQKIEEAIEFLCRADPDSRTTTEGGRRLVKTGSFAYRVVNLEFYRDGTSDDARRQYWKEYKRKKRTKSSKDEPKPKESQPCPQLSTPVHMEFHHADADADADATTERPPSGGSGGVEIPKLISGENTLGLTTRQSEPVALKSRIPMSVDDALVQCGTMEASKEFIMFCYDKANQVGWRNSRDIEIVNFPSYVRTEWKYERERIAKNGSGGGQINGADKIVLQKEFDRIDTEVKTINSSYDSHMKMTEKDRGRMGKLLERRKEIKNKLQIEV